MTRPLALAALALFVPFTVWVTAREGYLTYLTGPLTHWTWTQEFLDLCLALALVMVWMVKDARARGATVWPYLVATLLLGSIGPLCYLALRTEAPPAASPVI